MPQSKTKNVKPTIEEIYTSLTPHEHVLAKPGMYIGGTSEDNVKNWILDEEKNRIIFKTIKYIPGLYKIMDEILVNSRDQFVKDPTCNEIRVNINEETGEISIWNNGDDGIQVVWHNDANCYLPEFIFSHLRSSSHYGETNKKCGGTNGIGAKAANIYSVHFTIEVVDGERNLKYVQHFRNNMYEREEPVITKLKGKKKSYTCITFIPDYEKFKVKGLSKDMISLFKKRVYDLAAVTNVKVFLNDNSINIKSFNDYVKMYYEDEEIPSPPIYEVVNDCWKVAVVYDPNSGYRQISYVNGICTYQGGSHVNHVVEQITGAIYNKIMEKNKNLKVKYAIIKDNLTFFIDAMIDDPEFNSQTKEFLTTKVSEFGSRCQISEDFIKKLAKTGIIEEIVNFAKFKALDALKKTDGKKTTSLKGLPKLSDAHDAGSRNSHLCTLILTEGDSAKPFAAAGTEVVGKDRFGVFPLKGKLLNVREATPKQLAENEEIKNIKKIMGLKHNKKYTDVKELRYGRILILTDQDYDGAHIKGLLMNFIHFFWPSLITVPGFITTLKTPIVKVFKKTDTKKKNGQIFYTISEYNEWKKKMGDSIKLYIPKYYKGLGTSSDKEAKEAFSDFENKVIEFMWDQDDSLKNRDKGSQDTDTDTEEWDNIDKTNECHNAITLAFARNRANDRKKWLNDYDKSNILDSKSQSISFCDFINKDLIHFSNYDNERSIPSVCDGFKPSLRKILYGCMLRKIYTEIRVSQLSGYISDKTGYHHGEASLQGAIVGMAQNFVGSNNINWLFPSGNFGNREGGGKNASSARYIHTFLIELVPYCFREEDNHVLTYVDDDGIQVEPEFYVPIFCQLLVNGSEGIGTGFSTNIPPFNPKDIIKNTRLLINNKVQFTMIPYFKGFKGNISMINDKSFQTQGIYEIIDEHTIIITELPIGLWTLKYKKFLEGLMADDIKNPQDGQILKDFKDECGNNTIKFILTFLDNKLQDLIKKNEIEKKLLLISRHSLANLHAYDSEGKLKKYKSIEDIMVDHYKVRLDMYEKRKEHYLKILKNILNIVEWKIKFIDYVISGKIVMFHNKQAISKDIIIEKLVDYGFPELCLKSSNDDDENKSYNYLTNLKIFDLTKEERDKLMNEYEMKLIEFNNYQSKTVQEIWLEELDEFEAKYDKWLREQDEEDEEDEDNSKAKTKKSRKRVKKVVKK